MNFNIKKIFKILIMRWLTNSVISKSKIRFHNFQIKIAIILVIINKK